MVAAKHPEKAMVTVEAPIKKTCVPVDSVPMPGAVMVSDVRPVMAKEPEEMIAL